ncbi:MAG: hypothetical protein ABI151_15820, partial [Chitinophagaceae bacterium]
HERLHVLESIVKPVLMIIGKEDKAIPYAISLKQSHLPSCAYIHVLEKSGHMGMQEEFLKTGKILQDFLRDLAWHSDAFEVSHKSYHHTFRKH